MLTLLTGRAGSGKTAAVIEHIKKDVIYFLAKPNSFNIKGQASEIREVIWVNLDEVINYLSFDNIKELWIKEVIDKIKKIED